MSSVALPDESNRGPSATGSEGLLATIALLWLGFGLILLPTLKFFLWQLDSTGGAKALVGLVEAGFIFLVVANRDIPLRCPRTPRWVALLFIFWCVWSILAVATMEHVSAGILRQYEWFVHIAFSLSLFSFLKRFPHWTAGVIRFMLFSFLLTCLVILVLWNSFDSPREFSWRGGFAGFSHVRLFGHATLLTLTLSSAIFWNKAPVERWSQVLFYTLVACCAWTGLFWAGGRGPIMALIVALPISLIVFRRNINMPRLLAWFFLTGALGAVISLPLSLPEQGMGIERIFKTVEGEDLLNQYASNRPAAWAQFARHILQRPFLGEGPDGYLYYVPQTRWPHTVQPHNFLLQATFEWGVPGALAFAVLLAWSLLKGLKNLRQPDQDHMSYRRAALFTALALVVMSSVTGNLYHAWPTMIFFASLTIAWASTRSTGDTADLSRPGRPMVAVATLTAVTVFALCISVLYAVINPRIPESPTDIRVKLVKTFPAPISHPWMISFLDRWPDQWEISDEETCAWWQWVERHSGWVIPEYATKRTAMLDAAGCI